MLCVLEGEVREAYWASASLCLFSLPRTAFLAGLAVSGKPVFLPGAAAPTAPGLVELPTPSRGFSRKGWGGIFAGGLLSTQILLKYLPRNSQHALELGTAHIKSWSDRTLHSLWVSLWLTLGLGAPLGQPAKLGGTTSYTHV